MDDELKQGLAKGLISFDADRKSITYKIQNKKLRFTDPEEKIRARAYLSLVMDYGYSPEQIDIEHAVPHRVPNIFADIVVFADKTLKAMSLHTSRRRHAGAGFQVPSPHGGRLGWGRLKGLQTLIYSPSPSPSVGRGVATPEMCVMTWLKAPLIVVECKREEASQGELNQAVEQGFGYANSLQAHYLTLMFRENWWSALTANAEKPSAYARKPKRN